MWTIFFNLEIFLRIFRSKFHRCPRVSWANHLSTLDTLVLLGAAGFWRFSELEDPIHVPRTINTERVPTLSVQHRIQGQNCPNLAPFLLPTLLCSLSIQPVVFPQTSQSYLTWIQFLQLAGISLTLVYSSTNMSKSVWTSGFWKPLVHKNMSNFWNNIFHKLGLHFTCVRALRTFSVWTSELWCGRVTFLNHSSTIRVPKNP